MNFLISFQLVSKELQASPPKLQMFYFCKAAHCLNKALLQAVSVFNFHETACSLLPSPLFQDPLCADRHGGIFSIVF